MAARIHTNEILDQIIALIDANLSPAPPAGLGLKTIAKGGVEFYVGPDDFSVVLPAVFVKPLPSTDLAFVAVGQEYQVTHRHRLLYVRRFAPGDLVVEQKIADTLKIAELLIDNLDLGGLALSNGQIILSIPSSVEWEPVEDEFVASFNLDFSATAIAFDVTVRTRR